MEAVPLEVTFTGKTCSSSRQCAWTQHRLNLVIFSVSSRLEWVIKRIQGGAQPGTTDRAWGLAISFGLS